MVMINKIIIPEKSGLLLLADIRDHKKSHAPMNDWLIRKEETGSVMWNDAAIQRLLDRSIKCA